MDNKTEGRPAGNAAAMCEALNQLRDWALLDINENAIRSDEPNYRKLVDGIVEITNAALSKPPRNCDVGTAEEQYRRFDAFCDAHHFQSENCCSDCPCHGVGICEFKWGQLPYGGKEE